MIITITVILGLTLLSLQIVLLETKKQIATIKSSIPNMNQTQKPVAVGKLTRTIWVKSAPLYKVIQK